LLLGDGANRRLRHSAERETQIVDLRLRGGEEEVALVTFRVDRTVERAMRPIGPAADVVAGGECVSAEFLRRRKQVGELDSLVAGYAGDRRLAGHVARREGIDHRLAEALLVVEHIMRNAERLGNAPCIGNVLPGAARAGTMDGSTVIIELQRHADDVIALALQQAGDN
jgi:glycerate-2-kinase